MSLYSDLICQQVAYIKLVSILLHPYIYSYNDCKKNILIICQNNLFLIIH